MLPHYQIVTPPEIDPVSYDEAADHVRVDSSADMEYLTGLISVAREYVESATGRACLQAGYRLTAPSWWSIIPNMALQTAIFPDYLFAYAVPLMRSPIISVESVKYYAPNSEVLTTMDTADYRVITGLEPGMVQIKTAPPATEIRPDAIQINFTAGYSDPGSTPPTLRHAIKMLAAHLYENRLPVAFASCSEIPFTLKTILENQKIGGWVS